VHAVTRGPDGAQTLDGDGEAVEWALEMRRFDDGAVLADRAQAIDGDLAEALGREIARFHAAATPRAGPERLAYVLGSNAELLRAQAHRLGEVEPLLAATRAAYAGLAPLLADPGQGALVRRCHGDLHLGNIFLEDGRPVLFDCVEFNDVLSEIHVLYDLAFLLMDMDFRGAGAAADRALNGWLDEAARSFPPADLWAGLAALPLFQSVRAAVRAHVTVHQGEDELARRYLAAARAHLDPPPPTLTAVGGRSGSGKSRHARRIAPGLGARPGAVVLRSDEIRKRLWGRAPLQRLPAEAYARDESLRVYGSMFDAARACLAAGRAVVLDAAFLDPAERARAEALAQAAGVAFEGVWMEAPPEVLRARVAARTGDASDADAAVLERQLGLDVGTVTWRRQAE
jgi:aminoglycoside phosphotransferase family enzyme/predicted kinase